MRRKNDPDQLVQGTLDMLVLRALEDGARHGYDVLRHLSATTRGGLEIQEGAIYPALHRMAARGWLEAEWGLSQNNRRAKFYCLTSTGRDRLETEVRTWRRYVDLVDAVLGPAHGAAEAAR